jgi:cytoskeletal protein RodZ
MKINHTSVLRATGAAVIASLLAFSVSACSEENKDKASNAVSDATQKAGEAASSATAKAEETGGRAKESYASASASASARMSEVKDGMDAKDEVVAGEMKADGDRSAVEITASNKQPKKQSYVVQVNFRDAGGNLLDVAVVNVKDVEPGKDAKATARSNRTLKGDVEADIAKSLRH